MEELKLLIVEDDDGVIKTYTRDIDSFNKESDEFNITPRFEKTSTDAIGILKDSEAHFDGAIIDLDLRGTNGQDSSGNDVIKEIRDSFRIPVFVISGTTHNLEQDMRKSNDLFKIVDRDNAEFDFINEFIAIYSTGITKLLRRDGQIEKLINDIYWNHLSSSLDIWVNDKSRTSEQKEKSLLRYTLLHMLEYLDEEDVHPSEFYITKPVKEKLSTGDLIYIGDMRYVVLTPACDFVVRQNGSRSVTKSFLIKVKELSEEFANYDHTQEIGDASNNLKDGLRKIIRNNKTCYHFMPSHKTISPGIIDFQDKLSISIDEIEGEITRGEIVRVATISMPFLKDIIERYSSYYARQGSPDFDSEEILNSLFS